MGQKKLSKAIKTILASSLGIGFGLTSVAAFADDDSNTKVQKITVTGSSIKGVAAQSASPITIVKTEELAKQGVTTAEQALATVSANSSGFNSSMNVGRSGTVGSAADLRGLGANKTLVLLNGRRLANSPFDTSTVDLSTIPLALVERIEVLKDGASAIYGTDAIGGVINFITKKEYTGAGVSVGGGYPQMGGGQTQDYGIFGGYGHLDEDRFNVYGAFNYHKQDAVMASQRSFSKRGGVIPELGVNTTSSGSFPANIAGFNNPYPDCGNNPLNHYNGSACRFNSQALIGIIPEVETYSFLGKGTLKLTETLNAVAEYVHAETKTLTTMAPDVMLGFGDDYFVPGSSQYYPGNGKVPAVSGVTGQDISVNLRSQAGNRVSENKTTSDRVLVGLDGAVGKWDINTGLSFAKSIAKDSIASGYIDNQLVRDNLANGTLNPFGASADAGIWQSMSVTGLSQKAAMEVLNLDFTASRSIYTLPAGDVGFAIGGNLRHEKWQQSQNASVNSLVESLGVDPTQAPSKGSRNLSAIFTEFQIPILKTLSAQVAGRFDDYSDFGNTFNPKVALRWQPIKQVMFRTSYSTGFRAPSLNELNGANYKTNTQASWNDPTLCPGGSVAANGIKVRDCDRQFDTKTGGNKKLDAEKSNTFTIGTVIEPIKNLVFTIDYFDIQVKNQIGQISETAIFTDPTKYADKYIRKADGSLDYIDQSLTNLGETKTRGIDFGAQWRSPSTKYGRFGLSFDGTYVDSYKFQTEKGGEWIEGVGKYNTGLVTPLSPVVTRWKHTANINWNYEAWNLNLQQQFFKGYKDQNTDDQNHDVKDYTLYNLAGTYTGFKNTELTLGIRNLFNTKPPASNVTDNFQYGYDPRYADALLRTYYARATYKF